MREDAPKERIKPVAEALRLPKDYVFDSSPVLDPADLAALTDLRTGRPDAVREAMAERPRRETLTEDGRLVLLAADHPARMVISVGTDPVRMGNRADYLARIVRVLSASEVDGLMATPDVLEDVVALDRLVRRSGREGFLGTRVLVGSMNRGGLQNAECELWDMPTAYRSAEELLEANLDGGKVLWRYTREGRGNRDSLETMAVAAETISDLAREGLATFIEPLAMENRFEKWLPSRDEEDWIRIVGAASALGPTSARSWIKIPFFRPYHRIVGATTLPILMLGGPAGGVPAASLADFAEGMNAGSNVRGTLVGRNVLYPGSDDPALVARAVCHIVRGGLAANEAAAKAAERGRM